MKTRAQKSEELKRAKALLDKSQALIFADFTKITAENIRKLRNELKKTNGSYLVIKKRLLGLLLKEQGIDVDLKKFKISVGTIFSEKGIEGVAGPAFKFFSGLEVPEGGDKNMWIAHLLGGYDMKGKMPMDATQVVAIGKLPPREVLLAQVLGMFTAPLRSFMYIVDQKSKQGGASAKPVAAAAASTTPTAESSIDTAPAATNAAAG
ncbi:MAG TPA: 50S ribosomal protein L10 [Candidatus Paceibacterota bacterium]|jgi:large subunit ribosomal protein L10|nr:50S ribosomal protein L10 [Candidatus Paceibacterota bacterium]